MGMRFKKGDIKEFETLMRQYGERATRIARREMRRKNNEIMELAKINAPVLEENLENAIITQEEIGDRRRKEFRVTVDPSHPGTGKDKTVGDYAYAMHEGDYNPGPRSRQKMMETGRLAGRKYIERAFDEIAPTIRPLLIKALRKESRKTRRR